jgi:hypothetical protein
MKIGIFYSKLFIYVTSFHPKLYNELAKHNEIEIIDVSIVDYRLLEEKLHEFDLIVIDQSILISTIKDSNINFKRNVLLYNNKKLEQDFKNIFQLLVNANKLNKYFWLHADPHGIEHSLKDRIEALGEYYNVIKEKCTGFILPGTFEKFLPKEDVNPNYAGKSILEFKSAKDNLVDLIGIKPKIEIQHCVEYSEQKSYNKKWDICIPGVSYLTRVIAKKGCENLNINLAPLELRFKYLNYYFKYFYRWPSLDKKIGLGYKLIRYACGSSNISFVCGGPLQYFVRKFVEIPLYNTTMICYPSKDIEDYGFKHNEHAIFCMPEEVGIEAKKLLADPIKIQRLRDNAKALVLEKHTTTVRAQQLIKALQLAAKNKLVNSYFKNGDYVYDTK